MAGINDKSNAAVRVGYEASIFLRRLYYGAEMMM